MKVFSPLKSIILISFFVFSSTTFAANPSQPFLPSDNIQDPGCLPTDSNCYVKVDVVQNGGNSYGTTLSIGTNDNNALEFKTASTTRLTIDVNGNVGVGTSTLNAKMVVQGSGSEVFNALNTTGLKGLRVFSTGGGSIGTVSNINNSVFHISDDIDTTNPYVATLALGRKTSDGLAPIRLAFYEGYDLKASIQAGRQGASWSGYLSFSTRQENWGEVYEKMRITGEGNVGIGTTTPGQKLTVNGNALMTGSLTASSVITSGNIGVGTTTPSAKLAITGTEGSGNVFVVASSTNAQMFTVAANGNVGIGTTNPAYKLDVNGVILSNTNIYSPGLATNSIGPFSGQNLSLAAFSGNLTLSTNGGTGLVIDTSGNTSLNSGQLYVLRSNGNVGIGSTTPIAKLSVKGNSTGTGLLAQFTDSANVARLTVLDNGNIGVGISNPTAPLDIAGTLRTSSGGRSVSLDFTNGIDQPRLYASGGISNLSFVTTGGDISILPASGIVGLSNLKLGTRTDSATSITTTGGIYNSVNGQSLLFNTANGDVSADSFVFSQTSGSLAKSLFRVVQGGVDFFKIESSGRVGIGSSTPSAKLSVKGSGTGTGLLAHFTDSANVSRLTVLDNGNVGIDVSNPSSKLTVSGFISVSNGGVLIPQDNYYNLASGNGNWRIGLTTGAHAVNAAALSGNRVTFTYGSLSTEGLVFGPNGGNSSFELFGGNAYFRGNVGIGTTTPADRLQVFGDVRLGTTGTNGCIKDFGGTGITGTCSSDERLKTNIVDLSDGYLDKMNNLKLITYNWNNEANTLNKVDTTVTNYGLLAQNVEAIFPELVSVDSNGYKQVNYSRIPLYLLKAVQELSKKVSGFADRVQTKELCVDDICVTRDQFKQMLQNSGVQITPPTPNVVDDVIASSTEEIVEQEPVVEEEVVVEPEPVVQEVVVEPETEVSVDE